ncbi:MAG: LysM peptidoglycan-binding domain-containing protein [Caldilineales bacterium]|nr:LysM peptidoglycan-binding domain-containing protein [Caldilineales bacterium]
MAASRCGDSYRVRKGDTLAKIARKCDVKVSQLKRWNNLSSNRIRVNWVLKLRSPREIQKPPKDSAFEKAKILLDETVKKALPLPAFN